MWLVLVLGLLAQSNAELCDQYYPSKREWQEVPEPRYYPFVNSCKKEDIYENYAREMMPYLKYPDKKYKLNKFVDDGGTGNVYLATDRRTGRRVYLKQLKSKDRQQLEFNLNSVYFERLLDGSPFIQKPIEVIRHENGRVTLVYAYDKPVPFKLNRKIVYQVISALDYAHRKGIMHRDIKPANILIHQKSRARLIDWNMASLYYFSKQNDVELGTINYEAPEMLLNYPYYHYSLDMWGLGVTMLEYYYEYEFEGDRREEVLQSILKLLGTDVLIDYINKYNIKMDRYNQKLLKTQNYYPRLGIRSLKPVHKISKSCRNLLQKMLTFDHNDRIMSKEALEHNCFRKLSIRNRS